jgi:hypothetical protein
VQASLGNEPPLDQELEGAAKAYWAGEHRGHLVNHAAEIGWVEPGAEGKPHDDGRSLLGAQFDILAYEDSKYVLGWPPTMVYLPGAALVRSMVKAAIKEERGDGGRAVAVTASSEMMQQFTDLTWHRKRAEEKAAAAALAQGTTPGTEAQPGEPQPEEATFDALSGSGDGRPHRPPGQGGQRRSTKQLLKGQKRKQK